MGKDVTDLEPGDEMFGKAYPFTEAPEALAHVGTGHARAKVVITI